MFWWTKPNHSYEPKTPKISSISLPDGRYTPITYQPLYNERSSKRNSFLKRFNPAESRTTTPLKDSRNPYKIPVASERSRARTVSIPIRYLEGMSSFISCRTLLIQSLWSAATDSASPVPRPNYGTCRQDKNRSIKGDACTDWRFGLYLFNPFIHLLGFLIPFPVPSATYLEEKIQREKPEVTKKDISLAKNMCKSWINHCPFDHLPEIHQHIKNTMICEGIPKKRMVLTLWVKIVYDESFIAKLISCSICSSFEGLDSGTRRTRKTPCTISTADEERCLVLFSIVLNALWL